MVEGGGKRGFHHDRLRGEIKWRDSAARTACSLEQIAYLMEKPVANDLSSSGRVEDMTPGSGCDRKAWLGGGGWIVARGAGAAALGLLCAAALGEGWFVALLIPVLLTAVNLWHWRKLSRPQPPFWQRDRRT